MKLGGMCAAQMTFQPFHSPRLSREITRGQGKRRSGRMGNLTSTHRSCLPSRISMHLPCRERDHHEILRNSRARTPNPGLLEDVSKVSGSGTPWVDMPSSAVCFGLCRRCLLYYARCSLSRSFGRGFGSVESGSSSLFVVPYSPTCIFTSASGSLER